MKRKLLYIFTLIISFLFISNVKANSINSINMDIYIDNNGTAHITETWDAYLNQGTEGYKSYRNLGSANVTNLKVSDETREYTILDGWNSSSSFNEKAYKAGLHNISNGVEFCFGISKYGSHKYKISYDIEGFVARTEDADIVYWELLPSELSSYTNQVYIKIYADERFEDTLDVWGYGNYGGYAYVYDGYIEVSNYDLSRGDYVTVLIKFPLNTFNTSNTVNYNFDHYYEMAEAGATHYEGKKSGLADRLIGFVIFLFNSLIWIIIILVAIFSSSKNTAYGTKNLKFGKDGKKIPKDTPMFRDIPCNKDVFRAYWVACQYNLVKKKTDFLGTMLLKWHKEGKVKIDTKEKGKIFKKEDTVIVFNTSIETNIPLEKTLYDYMYEASKDGILETKEFEKWCRTNYSKILRWFDRVIDYETEQLVNSGKIEEVEKKSFLMTRKEYHVDPSMLDEAKQMKGLKEFFKEFKNMKDKEAIEVMLWEEYLMYAQIFGIANKVAEQFKKLYPDVITDYDYDTIVYFNTISYSGMSSAQSAKSAAEARASSYSSGGGGFSSGGGGGGSFGGGGGGGFR